MLVLMVSSVLLCVAIKNHFFGEILPIRSKVLRCYTVSKTEHTT